MNTFHTLTNALINLETYIDDETLLSSIKDAVASTIQKNPLVFSDQALIFNLRKLGEELHVTTSDRKVLTVRLAVVHPYPWETGSDFSSLAGSICLCLLPGMDVELSQAHMGDISARTMLARGIYSSLTPEDVDRLITLALSAIVLLHAINFSSYE